MTELEKRFDSKSLIVQGTNDIKLPEDLREGLDNFFAGGGISLDLLRKYYGLGESLRITPEKIQGAYI